MPVLEAVGDDTASQPAKATFEKLHPKLRELAYLKASLVNECHY